MKPPILERNEMVSAFNGLYALVWGVLKVPFYFILIFFILFVFVMIDYYLYFRFVLKRKRKKSTCKSEYKKRGFLARLLYDFPRQIMDDFFNYDPDTFPYKGIIIFTGKQGRGKTIAMVNEMLKMKKQYPLSKCITNLAFMQEDDSLQHWRQLLDYNNGSCGVIVGMDETQNWFSSAQSKNFPPEMLTVCTQNRKNRRIILGTAQSFYLLAKAIRTQCTEIRECYTFFGCLTVVRRLEPALDFEGNIAELKKKGYYFFVHNKELRESYDTYKCISALSNSGFLNKEELKI